MKQAKKSTHKAYVPRDIVARFALELDAALRRICKFIDGKGGTNDNHQ